MSKLKLGIVLFFMLSFYNLYSVNGTEVKTTGTFIDTEDRTKILNIILKNPANLVGDIQGLDNEITASKKAINKKIKALDPYVDKASLEQAVIRLRNILRHQIFYVHDSYIYADVLYAILQNNPYLVKLIILTSNEGKKATLLKQFQEGINVTKGEFEQAFNLVANWKSFPEDTNFIDIDFQKYEQLKETYNGNPIFKIMHNIRECIDCDISRKEVPLVRKFFEDQVVQSVANNFPNKNEQISIADFATGNLFQTFINVNKIAAQGYTNIRLNLIDLEYQKIINKYKLELTKKPSFINSIDIAPGPLKLNTELWHLYPAGSGKLNVFWNTYETGLPTYSPLDLSQIVLGVIQPLINDTLFNNTFAYFSMWFKNTPVNLEIVIYGDAADYLQDCKNDSSLKSNLLTAVDYFTDTQDIFEELRKNCLKPQAQVLGLVHDQEDLPDGKSASKFYFSRGAQDEPLKHFSIDLKTTALTGIPELPNTTDYYLQGVKELFWSANKKSKQADKSDKNMSTNLLTLSSVLHNLTNLTIQE